MAKILFLLNESPPNREKYYCKDPVTVSNFIYPNSMVLKDMGIEQYMGISRKYATSIECTNAPIKFLNIPIYRNIFDVKKIFIAYKLIKYKGNDVEFIVSDDCSSEDMYSLVNRYNDKRIRYVLTGNNLGHDKNILFALSYCVSGYAFILRSRDKILHSQINEVIKLIETNPDAAYYLFSAEDENGNDRLFLKNKVFEKGRKAAYAHSVLLVHPSGNIYNLKYLNLIQLHEYMNRCFNHRFGFVVHDIIRMHLAECGDFITSSKKVWVYTNTIKSEDIAVNSIGNGQSVYDPSYEYERFKCEFEYISNYIDINNRQILFKAVVRRFYRNIAHDFCKINRNKDMQKHYSFNEIEYDSARERKKFRQFALNCINNSNSPINNHLKLYIYIFTLKLVIYYPLKDFLVCIIKKTIKSEHITLLKKLMLRV